MVDTSKRILKLPIGESSKKLHYVLNSAIVNDPAPKLTRTKLESSCKSDKIQFDDHSQEAYTINNIYGPFGSVVLNPLLRL